MRLNILLLTLSLILSPIAYAGGDYHFIQIQEIKTLSNREHHIIFSLLEREEMDWYRENFPMYNCDSVTLKIEYKEWEWDDKLFLFIGDLFSLNTRVFGLKSTIHKLKEKINDKNEEFLLSDVEAFQYNPDDSCELISKTLKLYQKGEYASDTNFIQPIRHNSRIENRPTD